MPDQPDFRTYIIKIEKPARASDYEVTQYIKDALSHWCQNLMPPGAYPDAPGDPGDSMYSADAIGVSVIRG